MSPTEPDSARGFHREDADGLDREHMAIFSQAVSNVLRTKAAEHTFAQIIDGLPTIDSFKEVYLPMPTHPFHQLGHTRLCDGVLEKTREIRSRFEPSGLRFRRTLLDAFQATKPKSDDFNLRLIEMVAVACHAVAVYLYKQDDGFHKHQMHRDWRKRELDARRERGDTRKWPPRPPKIAFIHRKYVFSKQYPDGEADIAGYWAEAMIFGGVVVFDRGETDVECRAVYLHDTRLQGPRTLYPPTESQMKALLELLYSSPEIGTSNSNGTEASPLPMLASKDNRYRWDPVLGMKDYHIFRDRYERDLDKSQSNGWRWGSNDWPEHQDDTFLLLQTHKANIGNPVDQGEIAAAKERMKQITPTSPLWGRYSSWVTGIPAPEPPDLP